MNSISVKITGQGGVPSLETTATSVVGAINELHTEIGTLGTASSIDVVAETLKQSLTKLLSQL